MEKQKTLPPADGNQQLGEDISFGLEQTLLCLSTDAFTDPLISEKIQEKLGGKYPDNLKKNFIAELCGDIVGFVSFVTLRSFFRPVFNAAKDGIKSAFNPLYDNLGRAELRLAKGAELNPEESRKLEAWKEFEADTFVKSNVLSLLSTTANAGIMKAMKAPYSWGVLLISKFTATLVTTAGMIGLRLAMPQTMRSMDRELSKRYIEPVIDASQRAVGITPVHPKDPTETTESEKINPKHDSWLERTATAEAAQQVAAR